MDWCYDDGWDAGLNAGWEEHENDPSRDEGHDDCTEVNTEPWPEDDSDIPF